MGQGRCADGRMKQFDAQAAGVIIIRIITVIGKYTISCIISHQVIVNYYMVYRSGAAERTVAIKTINTAGYSVAVNSQTEGRKTG